jgi:hypothetical protein
VLNFGSIAALPALANGVIVPICDGTCSSDLIIQADVSSVHVVVDVLGYFRTFAGPGGSNVPSAYGFINSNGSVSSATSNVSSTYNAAQSRYEITITGESYFFNDYVTVITAVNNDVIAKTDSISGNLLVYLRTGGAATQSSFQFVTFKP